MEVLSFKLSVSSGNRIRLHSASPRPSSSAGDERYGCIEPVFAPAAAGSSVPKHGRRARFEFFEALQNHRIMRRGYRVFLKALEREKVRNFTVK